MRVNFKPPKSRNEKKKRRMREVKALTEEARRNVEEGMSKDDSVMNKMENLGLNQIKRK
jgi:hypothetical protein